MTLGFLNDNFSGCIDCYIVVTRRMNVNEQLKTIWKETVITNFRVVFQYVHGHSEENNEKLRHDSYYLGQDSNPGPPGCKEQVLATLFHSRRIRMAGK
jgi:hypothetical protein